MMQYKTRKTYFYNFIDNKETITVKSKYKIYKMSDNDIRLASYFKGYSNIEILQAIQNDWYTDSLLSEYVSTYQLGNISIREYADNKQGVMIFFTPLEYVSSPVKQQGGNISA